MTPPDYLRGELGRSAALRALEHNSGRVELPPDLQQLTATSSLMSRFSLARSMEELSRIRRTDEPDPNALPEVFQETVNQARQSRNPQDYITAMRLLAGIIPILEEGEQEASRQQAVELALEASQAIANSTLGSREKVSRLYDLTVALTGALARPSREPVSEAEGDALLDLFRQILAAIEANDAAAAAPQASTRPTPPYMRSYCEAQIALWSGNADLALQKLLETRNIIAALPQLSEQERGGIRDQIALATELAIQALPRDPSGRSAQAFRARMGWELLGYFYRIDEHGEDQDAEASRQAAQFNLVAGLAEDAGILPNLETGRFEDAGRTRLRQTLETLYTANEAFRHAVESWGLGDLRNKTARDQAWNSILDHAAEVFTHIHTRREDEPYRSVLEWLQNQRRIEAAVAALEDKAELKLALSELLGLPPTLGDAIFVRSLVEYGPLLPRLLNELPQAIRANPEYRDFFNQLRQATRGLRGEEGIRENLSGPTEELFGILDHLTEEHDDYAPAFGAFYHSLAETQEVQSGVELPRALRDRARTELTAIESFNWERVVDHVVFNPESIAMILGGSILAEVGSVWLLGRAGQVGRYRALVEGGQLTWRGEMALGLGVAVGMSTFSTITHLVRTDRPVGEELSRIGPGLVMGTLLSGVALGATIGINRYLARGVLAETRATSGLWRGLGRWGFSTAIGGGLMLGAGSLTNGITTQEWRAPTAEETAEMFLTMALWDLSARGLRRVGSRWWWRRQIGPHRAHEVDALAQSLHEVNPQIEADFLRNYLGMRVARGRGLQEISLALRQGYEPVLEGTGNRRTVVFREPRSPASEETQSQPPAPERAEEGPPPARPSQETETGTRAQRLLESAEFQELMSSLHREVVYRLQRNPQLERIRIRLTRTEGGLRFEFLNGEASAHAEPANTFEMGPEGVPIATSRISDPVTRAALERYGDFITRQGLAETRRQQFDRSRRAPPAEQTAAPISRQEAQREADTTSAQRPAAESIEYQAVREDELMESGSGTAPRRPARRPRRPTPTDAEQTMGIDMGDLLHSNDLAEAVDHVVREGETRNLSRIFVEIDLEASPIFQVIAPEEFMSQPGRGYFILRREPRTQPSGTFHSVLLQGEPFFPEAWRRTGLADYIKRQFSGG